VSEQAKIYELPKERLEQIRLSSVEQRELTEDELRGRYSKNRRPWDRKGGGDCPYKIDANDKVVRGYKDLGAKPSLIDRLMPNWLRYGLVFAAVAFVAAAIDLYIISLTPFVVAGLAVIAVRRMEGRA